MSRTVLRLSDYRIPSLNQRAGFVFNKARRRGLRKNRRMDGRSKKHQGTQRGKDTREVQNHRTSFVFSPDVDQARLGLYVWDIIAARQPNPR